MEMHMVHVNSKYLNDDGTVDPVAYQTSDGLAVLGFMFKVKSSEVTIIQINPSCYLLLIIMFHLL